jgi:ribonuclease Y
VNEFIYGLAGLLLGLLIGLLLKKFGASSRIKEAEEKAQRIVRDALKEAETKKKEAVLETKDVLYQAKADFERETKERKAELANLEKRFLQREENLERKMDLIDKKEAELSRKEREFVSKEKTLDDKIELYNKGIIELREMLERVAGMTSEEAKKQLMKDIEDEARLEAAKSLKRIEDETRECADRKSREIMALAVQRYSSDFVAEATVSAVNLPNDEMKGRIIGREGRNIRALESATGIDLIIDDTPGAVILSCFDPIRREIAKISIERLIADGRIHPARIEEVVDKVKKEVENTIREEGEKAIIDLGLHGVHPEIVRMLGKLRYRTSYGQNVLMHSREVAYFSSIMAGELGLDQKLAKRAGLLHDIGKSVDHEIEGAHAQIGADLAKKYGENYKVVNAIMAHHGESDPICIESVLVSAADALSASRPGVRKESYETYVKRLEKLEDVAKSFKGVDKCYAIQAGREIRIIVKPEDVTDVLSSQISRDIAKKIEEELAYPGQIKVTVIRESRFVEYAK